MTTKDIKTEEIRMKELFRKIEVTKPADDFTMRIMQRISAENIVIEKQKKPFNWFPYLVSVIMMLTLVFVYLPELTQWTDYMIQTVFPDYTDRVRNAWHQLYTTVTSLHISPLILIILGSCSLLFTLVGLANAGEMLSEKE